MWQKWFSIVLLGSVAIFGVWQMGSAPGPPTDDLGHGRQLSGKGPKGGTLLHRFSLGNFARKFLDGLRGASSSSGEAVTLDTGSVRSAFIDLGATSTSEIYESMAKLDIDAGQGVLLRKAVPAKKAKGEACTADEECTDMRCGGIQSLGKYLIGKCLGPAPEGYPLYLFGGDDFLDVKRKKVDYVPSVTVYRLPVGTNPKTEVTIDGDVAKIPLSKKIIASYARINNDNDGMSMSGTAVMRWTDNPSSPMSSDPLALCVAKLHTMQYHKGEWPTHSADRIQRIKSELAANPPGKLQQAQKSVIEASIKTLSDSFRSLLTDPSDEGPLTKSTARNDLLLGAGALLDIGNRYIESLVDKKAVEDIYTYTQQKEEGGNQTVDVSDKLASESWATLSGNAKKWLFSPLDRCVQNCGPDNFKPTECMSTTPFSAQTAPTKQVRETDAFKAFMKTKSYRMCSERCLAQCSDAGKPTSLKSESVCLHFDASPGFYIDEDTEFLYVPLKKNMIMYTGQNIPSPLRVMGAFAGSSVWAEVDGHLEIYYTASMHGVLQADPNLAPEILDQLPDSAVYVGPVDGKAATNVPDVDGRTREFQQKDSKPTDMQYELFRELETTTRLVDYDRMWKAEENCGSAAMAVVDGMIKKMVQQFEVNNDDRDLGWLEVLEYIWPKAVNKDNYGIALRALSVLNTASASIDCMAWYLRSDLVGTHSYGIQELLVHAHTLSDLDPATDTYAGLTFKLWEESTAQHEFLLRSIGLGGEKAAKNL